MLTSLKDGVLFAAYWIRTHNFHFGSWKTPGKSKRIFYSSDTYIKKVVTF